MGLIGSVSSIFAPIIAYALAHPVPVGIGLLAVGALLAFLARGLSRLVLAVGLVVTAVLAYREWQAAHSLIVTASVGALGVGASLAVSAVVRFLAVVLELAALAAGWYLLVYASLGTAYLATTPGLATWGLPAVASALLVDRLARRGRAVRAVPLRTPSSGTA